MQLIILIHGMWGKAGDFNYIVEEMCAKHNFVKFDDIVSDEKPGGSPVNPNGVVYCARSNEGYFTYDGIDICGLRIANEITRVIKELKLADVKVTDLSIVGYSMGGVMARYAIGLLYTRGVFDEIKPKVFVSTCSPHVGVNVLGGSKGARLFNLIGSWSMARTSRQAFLKDTDQTYHMPLFLFLTQANTACSRALSLFQRRILYANVANDHRCEFYTSAVEAVDPYKHNNLNLLSGPFVLGYEPVVLDGGRNPNFESLEQNNEPAKAQPGFLRSWLFRKVARAFKLCYLVARIGVVIPLWFCAFLVNAGYQHTASSLRIRSTLRSGDHVTDDVPYILESSAEGMVEDVYRTVQDEVVEPATLQLTPLMSRIVEQFNTLGWEKFYLRIVATPKAHSAAVMKLPKRKDFYEGKQAVKHLISSVLN